MLSGLSGVIDSLINIEDGERKFVVLRDGKEHFFKGAHTTPDVYDRGCLLLPKVICNFGSRCLDVLQPYF